MPQFDFNSNKYLLLIFCFAFFIFVYMFLVIFNTVIKFINFYKFYVLNVYKFNLLSNNLIFISNLDEEKIFKSVNFIYY